MEKCRLRALELSDIDFLYHIENQELLWEVSQNQLPFSKSILLEYLKNAKQDIYEAKQFRYGIESADNQLVGFIDLYDFDPKNKRSCIGIVIAENFRRKGFGKKAVEILEQHAQKYFDLHQLIAYVSEDNQCSRLLFEKLGFVCFGLKKDWIFSGGKYKNVIIYQKIFNE